MIFSLFFLFPLSEETYSLTPRPNVQQARRPRRAGPLLPLHLRRVPPRRRMGRMDAPRRRRQGRFLRRLCVADCGPSRRREAGDSEARRAQAEDGEPGSDVIAENSREREREREEREKAFRWGIDEVRPFFLFSTSTSTSSFPNFQRSSTQTSSPSATPTRPRSAARPSSTWSRSRRPLSSRRSRS